MKTYTRRVQTVLTDEQYELLKGIAEEQGKSVSVLVREAIEDEIFRKERQARKQEALEDLLSLNAPVSDWEDMEAEIIEGAMDG